MVVGFLASRTGRWLRIVTGASMVLGGLARGTSRGAAVALAGLAPLVAATLDLVLLAPVLGYPLRGADIRRELGEPEDAPLLEGRANSAHRVISTAIH